MQLHSPSQSNFLAVFRIRPFFLLWTAQVLSQISVNMLTFVLGILIYEKTHSNTAVSLLYLTVGLPAAAFGIVSGVLVDRLDKRRVLLFTTIVRFILLILIYFSQANLGMIYVLTGILAVVSQFFIPAEAVLIPGYVPHDLLLSANSLFTMTFYSAIIGGFVLGGPLINLLGKGGVIMLLTILFGISWLILHFLPKAEIKAEVKEKIHFSHLVTDIKSAFVYLKEVVIVRQAMFLLTFAQAIIAIFVTLGPGFADQILLLKLTDASLVILGPATIGMIVGALFVGGFGGRYRKRQLINVGIYTSGLLLLFIAFLSQSTRYHRLITVAQHIFTLSLKQGLLPLSIASFFFLGFANSLIDVSCNTVIQENTDEKIRGRMYGILASLIGGVAILPVIISGIIADLFGISKIIFILGLGLTLFGLYTGGIWGKIKKRFTMDDL